MNLGTNFDEIDESRASHRFVLVVCDNNCSNELIAIAVMCNPPHTWKSKVKHQKRSTMIVWNGNNNNIAKMEKKKQTRNTYHLPVHRNKFILPGEPVLAKIHHLRFRWIERQYTYVIRGRGKKNCFVLVIRSCVFFCYKRIGSVAFYPQQRPIFG